MERVLVVAVANSFNSATFKQTRRDSTLRSVAVIYVPVEIGLPTDCVMAAGPEISRTVKISLETTLRSMRNAAATRKTPQVAVAFNDLT
jgi:hypothetical protein